MSSTIHHINKPIKTAPTYFKANETYRQNLHNARKSIKKYEEDDDLFEKTLRYYYFKNK